MAATVDPASSRRAEESLARARSAALDLERALTELCQLGFRVTVRVEPGFEEGKVTPSAYFVEVDAT